MTEEESITRPEAVVDGCSANSESHPVEVVQEMTEPNTPNTGSQSNAGGMDPLESDSSMIHEQSKETPIDNHSDDRVDPNPSEDGHKAENSTPEETNNPGKTTPPEEQKQVPPSSKDPQAESEKGKPSVSTSEAKHPSSSSSKESKHPQWLRPDGVPDDVCRWLFRKEDLMYLSFHDKDKERDTREVTCLFLKKIGNLIGLAQPTIAASTVFWQRFYARSSVLRSDRIYVALAALLLACKVRNDLKANILEAIILCAAPTYLHRSLTPLPPPARESHAMSPAEMIEFNKKEAERERFNKQAGEKMTEEKNKVCIAEMKLLCFLNFDFAFDHPYKWLISCVKRCGGENVAKDAWVYTNDSFVTNVAIRFPPEVIACAALSLAYESRKMQFVNPKTNKSWLDEWGVPAQDVKAVQDELKDLYDRQRKKNAEQAKRSQQEGSSKSSSTTSTDATSKTDEKPKVDSSEKDVPPSISSSSQATSATTTTEKSAPSIPVDEKPREKPSSHDDFGRAETNGSYHTSAVEPSSSYSHQYRRERSHSHEHDHDHSGDERPPNRRQRRGSQEHNSDHHQAAPYNRDRDYNRDRERRHQRQDRHAPY